MVTMKSPSIALAFFLASSANAFTVNRPAAAASIRITTALHVDLPRLDLPAAGMYVAIAIAVTFVWIALYIRD